jgi:DNA primase
MAQLMARRAAERAEAEATQALKKAEWAAEQARISETRKEMAEKLRIVDQKVKASTASSGSRQETPQPRKTKRTKPKDDTDEDASQEEEPEEEIVPKKRPGRTPMAGRSSALSKDFISSDDEDEGPGKDEVE